MQKGACSIVQVDVGRIGGITPWLKVAHVAEAFDIAGLPAFPDGAACQPRLRRAERRYVEYIPQLDDLTGKRMAIEDGHALAPDRAGHRHRLGLGRGQGRSIAEFTTAITDRETDMQRMGMVLGLKPEKVEEYKRLHAAVWPEVLAMISACNIRNYSIYPEASRRTCCSATSNITAPTSPPTWRRWPPTRRPRNGGPSACPARSRWPPARKASGGR